MSGTESAGEEMEEVTRCVCGNIDLRVEEDYEDTGLFVQCDKCLVWQHGYCVGLVSDSQMPETYFCELCRPDLHRMIQRPRKFPRSKFLGVDNAASPPLPTQQLHQQQQQQQLAPPLLASEETNELDVDSGLRKRRSTMNSRDAAYDRQLEAALLLSAQQDGGSTEMPAPMGSVRSGRGTRRLSPSVSKRGRTPSPSPPREDSKQKRRRKGGSVKREEVVQDEMPVSRRRGGKKKGGLTSQGSVSSSLDTPDAKDEQVNADDSSQTSRAKPNIPDKSAITQLSQAESRPGSRAGSRESTPVPSIGARKRGGARTNKKTSTASNARNSNTTTTVAAPSTPSGRMTAMSDMRKRVSAILEYVGRTQEEMATEITEWGQFVPSELLITEGKQPRDDTVWGYGYGEGGSVELMEELTSSLLRWESIYG